jgi:hypothetical protein
MLHTGEQLNNQLSESGQPTHRLGQPNLSDEIVRRGREALDRKRRDYDDWLLVAEALQVGRADVMRAVSTNQPTGKRYNAAMAEWLLAQSFHIIDKGTRAHLLECLQHRTEIEKWRGCLTEPERFRFNHPDTVLRKWKAATQVPKEPKAPSSQAKLKAANVELQEQLHRAERELSLGGGDLWSPNDTPNDIATVMLVKLSPTKAERVARLILKGLGTKKTRRKARNKRKPVGANKWIWHLVLCASPRC